MKYFDIFQKYKDMEGWFGSKLVPTDRQILFAVYSYEDYSGAAFCLFKIGKTLYEAHCSHCSCNGLDYWDPEETSWEALAMRPNNGWGQEADKYLQNLVKTKGRVRVSKDS